MQEKDVTYTDERQVKIMRFSQVAMVLTGINHVIQCVTFSAPALGLSAIVLLISSVITEVMIKWIRSGKVIQGFRGFLVIVVILLFVSFWLEGGLYSTSILAVPILLMFAALYGRLIDNICLCIAVIFMTLFIGLNKSYEWLPVISGALSSGYYRLIPSVILIALSGYITWAIGHDVRQAFQRLREEYKRIEDSKSAITQLSKTDFLTGLVNTKQAKVNYEALLKGLPVGHRIFFYFIDLDGFKVINDLFDHKTGDDLLVSVAKVLKSTSADEAQVCRLSGDEFVVFFVAKNRVDATGFANQLLEKIAEPLDLYGTEIQITASIGIATTSRNSFDELRKKADMAMYRSKRREKNSYHMYSDALEKEYMKRIYVIQGLQECLYNGALELHYQPKIDLASQNVQGVEALIRWPKNNPQNYTPDQFMGVIESTELVHNVGDWVIKEACVACQSWHLQGHKISVAVNVSAQQLLKPSFSETVARILSSVGLDPEYLEIELTERYFVDNSAVVDGQLMALRKIGVKLAIDDFGTGYSNVSYLTDLDVDVLKLDQSFIRQLSSNKSIQHIVQGITQIAQVMGMKVIAEGVETDTEMAEVIKLGCDIGQGYHWAKPMNFESMLEYLSEDDQHFTNNSIA